MSEKSSLNRTLISLMIFYIFAVLFALLASASILLHVNPYSKCLLYSSHIGGGELSYGNYASCMMVGYVYLGVVLGASFLFVRSWVELRRRSGHAPTGEFENQNVPNLIFMCHLLVMGLAFLLTIVVTAGYVAACENIRVPERERILEKLNEDPYKTRGEELDTRFEDDYKFHRYTNRYSNSWGADVYTVQVTCRAVLTDPHVHQKLHDQHAKKWGRYIGWWYQADIWGLIDSQAEATKANSLIEACMAGCWLNFACLLAGVLLILVQKLRLRKEAKEMDRISVHSNMLGVTHQDGSFLNGGSSFRRDGSLMSGSMRGSNFQRDGSIRGSNRSMRRDIDDIALSNHLSGSRHFSTPGLQQPLTGYGRKDMDDMVLNQHMNQFQHGNAGSQYSSRETGYVSDGYHDPQIGVALAAIPADMAAAPYVPQPMGNGATYPNSYTKGDSTYMERSEVETEIF